LLLASGGAHTMRDFAVDIRFVLFVLDAVAKADTLLDELGVEPSTPR
jgi:hypothetical protein